MRIVVTEGASTLAYHLVQLLASGDVIQNQTIDLVLCDNVDKQDILTGVVYELIDCVYPALASVQISSDLCNSFKTSDVVLVLPKPVDEKHPKDVEIDFTELKQIDFQVLDGVFHPIGFMKQDSCQFKSKGVMSTAMSIARCLQEYHNRCLKATNPTPKTIPFHEEAEFGFVHYMDCEEDISQWLGPVTQERVLLMHTTARNSVQTEEICEPSHINEQEARWFLSRL